VWPRLTQVYLALSHTGITNREATVLASSLACRSTSLEKVARAPPGPALGEHGLGLEADGVDFTQPAGAVRRCPWLALKGCSGIQSLTVLTAGSRMAGSQSEGTVFLAGALPHLRELVLHLPHCAAHEPARTAWRTDPCVTTSGRCSTRSP
jgi:hypothetical protein